MKPGDRFALQFTVTEAIWSAFVTLFNDRNPLHTDDAFARERGFAGRVMHGNILGGFLSNFVGENLPHKDVIIHRQSISYANPVYLGDQLDFHAEVSDVHESVNAVEFSFRFEREGLRIAKGTIQVGFTRPIGPDGAAKDSPIAT